jgi:hypothetical protein
MPLSKVNQFPECKQASGDNHLPARRFPRLDYELRRGRTFAAAKSMHAIRRPNTMPPNDD